MNEAEMTVQEYVKRRHQEIDLFLAFWEEKLKEGHPHYPNYLPAMSDWVQHLNMARLLFVPICLQCQIGTNKRRAMLRCWTRVDQPTELLSEPGALCANRFLD